MNGNVNNLDKKQKQNIQIKKQSLIFNTNNYQSISIKPKKSQKIINNFHEMEIKLRKNRQITNASPILDLK